MDRVRAWEFFHAPRFTDLETDIGALEIFSVYRSSDFPNYTNWTEATIRQHIADIQDIDGFPVKFRNDPELIEEWETLRADNINVSNQDLSPSSRYWNRANDLDHDLGRQLNVHETGGFSNTPNIQGYGVLRFEDFSPSPNTAFSGVFDTETGRFMIYPSGNTTYANGSSIPDGYFVPRRGGHRHVREKMIDYYDDLSLENAYQRVVGFTIKFDTPNELKIEFFSRSLNYPFNRNASGVLNLQDPFIPLPIRPQLINALETEFNTVRGYNFDIIPINE